LAAAFLGSRDKPGNDDLGGEAKKNPAASATGFFKT
jgi:hypothetical protein